MRSGWLVLIVLTVSLSGCTDGEGGGFFEIFTGGSSLGGECGHVFDEGRARQIIIDVEWTQDTAGHAAFNDVEVKATYHGEAEQASSGKAPSYSTKNVDSKGCIGFPVDQEGGYSFWGFAESSSRSDCYLSGRLAGTFNGEEVVGGTLYMDQLIGNGC